MEEEFLPKLIELEKSESKGGVLSYLEEGENLPFKARRIFWVYDVSNSVERGNHCHEYSHRVIICLQGEIKIHIVDLFGVEYSFVLNKPNKVVYFPPKHWLKMTFSRGAILLSAASHLYEEDKTITDFNDFQSFRQI